MRLELEMLLWVSRSTSVEKVFPTLLAPCRMVKFLKSVWTKRDLRWDKFPNSRRIICFWPLKLALKMQFLNVEKGGPVARTAHPSKTNTDSFLNAMLASILLLLGLFLVLMYIFAKPERKDTAVVATPAVKTETSPTISTAAVPNRLRREEERLERLQQDYANVNARQADVEQMNSRIENLSTQVQTLQRQIAENQIQLGQIHATAAEQERQMLMDQNSAQIGFENQLQQIQNEQIYLQNRIPAATSTTSASTTPMTSPSASTNATINASINPTVNPTINASLPPANTGTTAPTTAPVNNNTSAAQINELEARKGQVATAMRVSELESQNRIISARQDLQAVRDDMLAARDGLRRELNDTNEELKYWKNQKAQSGNENLRLERLSMLQKQIDEQLGVVKQLRAVR